MLTCLSLAALSACNKGPDAGAPPAQAVPTVPAEPAPPPPATTAPQPVPAARTGVPLAERERELPAQPPVQEQVPAPAYAPAPQAVYADYQPALSQPQPVAVPWAPPPMLAEYPPPPPSPDAYWTGGYWVWRNDWVWAPGRWTEPPRPRYHWVPPYYEHRRDRVVFVDGFWAAPGVDFVAPAAGLTIALAVVGGAFAHGHAPDGPQGPFLPPPPGSRPGLLVPAPIGIAPYVMTRAPAIVSGGMQVRQVVNNTTVNRTTINNRTTVVNNIQNVTIQAPASATVGHQAVNLSVPAHAHLAAAQGMLATPSAPQRLAEPTAKPMPAQVPTQTPRDMPSRRDTSPPLAAQNPAMNRSTPPAPAAVRASREPVLAVRPVAPAPQTGPGQERVPREQSLARPESSPRAEPPSSNGVNGHPAPSVVHSPTPVERPTPSTRPAEAPRPMPMPQARAPEPNHAAPAQPPRPPEAAHPPPAAPGEHARGNEAPAHPQAEPARPAPGARDQAPRGRDDKARE